MYGFYRYEKDGFGTYIMQGILGNEKNRNRRTRTSNKVRHVSQRFQQGQKTKRNGGKRKRLGKLCVCEKWKRKEKR